MHHILTCTGAGPPWISIVEVGILHDEVGEDKLFKNDNRDVGDWILYKKNPSLLPL
jgi:hypothetical protein